MCANEIKVESETSKNKGHTRVQWAAAVLVNLAPLTYGLQLGWVSPMTKVLQSAESPTGRPLTDAEISLIAGVPSLAAVIGIPLLLYVVDTYGRRCASLMISIFQLTCWIIKLCPATFTTLLIARISCGFGAGSCFHVIPMYIKELSQDNIRGALGSIGILFQNMGILAMYCLGSYLDYYTVLYLVIGLPLLNAVMLLKAPESPSFLVKRGKTEAAVEVIAFLRGLDIDSKDVVNEIDTLKRQDEYFKSIPNITFFKIFKDKAWCNGFTIMFMIFICYGLNGTFFIVNYASNLLGDSDMNVSPELQTLGIPLFLVIGSLITMSFVDKLGRKIFLGSSFIISGLIFTILASATLLQIYGWVLPVWLPIIAILITMCCYGAAIAPLPFIISAEIFNFQIRAKLMACLSVLAWFMSFVQIILFTTITSYLGVYASFYIFGIINFLGTFITIVLLPETSGKNVDEIYYELRKGRRTKESSYDC